MPADPAHVLTDDILDAMELRLTVIYKKAEKGIQKTAEEYFNKFTELDQKKSDLVKAGKLSEAEYKTWRRNKMLYGKRFTELKRQIADQLLHVNETAMAYINKQLPKVYALNYNALSNAVDGVGGYSFTLTDANTVRHLALADKSLLPYKELNPAKDIPWNMKRVNGEVLQGIIQGDSIPKIAARIKGVEQMNGVAAVRTARTIVTEAENKGRQDSYEKAHSDGIELKRRWIATNDSRTRDWHAALDGVEVGLDEPWENEVGPIMFPGDPAADGANVYNCRCTMEAVVTGFKKR